MRRENFGFMQIILAAFLGSFIPILVILGESFGTYNLAFFRIFVAVLFLGIFFFVSKHKLTPFKYERGKMVLFGALHGFIILGYFLSLKFLTIASAVLLFSTYPLWMAVFSYFILKEKISKRVLFALIISFFGVFILVSPREFFIYESLIGSLAVLFSAVFAGMVFVLSKTFKKYDKTSLVFWQNLIAIPFVLPLLLITLPIFTLTNTIIVLLMGSLFTVVPFILIFKGLKKVKAHKAGVFMILETLFPILLAFFIFQQIPKLETIIGGLFIIFGVFLVLTVRD